MRQAGLGLIEALTDVAVNLAHKRDLVSEQGVIICWNCRDADALLPSLHCPRCLQAYRRKHGIDPQTVNVAQGLQTVDISEPQRRPMTEDEINQAMGE